jgi:hypothetical protein
MIFFKNKSIFFLVFIIFSSSYAQLSKTVQVAIVDIEKIEIIRGATLIGDGASTPTNTDVCADIQGVDYVELKAIIEPNIPETDIPVGIIIWNGGEEVPGHPLQRLITKAHLKKHTISVEIMSRPDSKKIMLVYIIGAIGQGTKHDGTSYADNSEKGWMVSTFGSTGKNGPDPTSGAYNSHIQIEFKIQPDDLLTDANANLFNKNDIKWDVSRDKRVKYWKKRKGIWALFDDRGDIWASDDPLPDDEEDNNPWDGNGHLYGNDAPGVPGGFGDNNNAWFVSKLNMREWVRVGLGGETGRNGDICSDYIYWRAFRSIRDGGSINTGLNGICNTTKIDDDIQVIELNKGDPTHPNELAVSAGANNTIDAFSEGDDVIDHNWEKDDTYDNELEDSNDLTWGNTPP